MAMVAVTEPATAATPTPATTAQTKVKRVRRNRGRLDGVRRNYRSAGGKQFEKTEDVMAHILALIETQPRKPKELCKLTGYDRMTIWRYCDQLAQEGKIDKEGHYWKKKSATVAQVNIERAEEISKEEFAKLPIMAPWIEKLKDNPTAAVKRSYGTFKNICLGGYISNFKCNPANWQYKETTKAFVEAYRKHTGQKKINRSARMAVRAFISICLGINIRENTFLDNIGLDGGKDNIGAHSDVMLSEAEIEEGIKYFANDLEMRALLAFNMEAMPRSERGLLIELSGVAFEDQTVEQAWLKNYEKPVRDPDQLQMLHALALALPDGVVRFENIKRRIAIVNHHESKTNDDWETYIITPGLVQAAEQWLERRKKAGFRYVFYDGMEDTKESQEGSVLKRLNKERGYREKLRDLYQRLGKIEKDAYFDTNPMYALRHCGAQLMLARTNYDYDYVAEHGWNDTATLRTWYGHQGKASLKDKLLHK